MRKEVADVLSVVDRHLESFIVVDMDDALQFIERLSREMQKRLDKIEEQVVREDDPRLEWIEKAIVETETKRHGRTQK